MKVVTQAGVSATTTAALVRSAAIRSAVLPRVQPNQAKPTIMVAMEPRIRPHAAGLNHGTCRFMRHLSGSRSRTSSCGARHRPPVYSPPSGILGSAGLLHECALTSVAPAKALEGVGKVRAADLTLGHLWLSQIALPAPARRCAAEPPGTSSAAIARAAGRGLLHPQLPAVYVLAVELRDRLIGFFRRSHLDEAEAARATGFTIGHDCSRFDLAGCCEHFAEPFRRCGERETADEQFLRHGELLLLLPLGKFMRSTGTCRGVGVAAWRSTGVPEATSRQANRIIA